MKLDFKYYFSIFLRRSPYFILVCALFASIGLTIAIILPSEYEAQATLLVEQEQIPEQLAASTVQTAAAEQIQIIQQRLLARENLLDIANRLDLFKVSDGEAQMSSSEIVRSMRDRVSFQQTTTSKSRRNPGTTILTISYRDKSPSKVAEVTNEFVTLLLEENLQIRTDQAGDTLAFFTQEVERLGSELDAKSVQLIEFQNQAGLAVPSNLVFLRTRQDDLQKQRADNRRTIENLESQKKRLKEMFRVTGGVSNAAPVSPLEQSLIDAKRQLSDAQIVYSDQNPRVTMLKARVAQLEKQVSDAAASALEASENQDEGAGEEDRTLTPQELALNTQLEQIDQQISVLQEEIESITKSIAVVDEQLKNASANGVTLAKLQRDYANIQSQYDQAVSRLSVAATGERIELLSKGQRISVIEQATPPDRPTKPDRPLIAASGVGAGVVLGLALIVLMEFMNRSIRRPIELTNRLGITPFAVLPYIRTQREVNFRRLAVLGTAVVLVIIVPLGLFALHSFVFPLDSIIESVFNKAGFSVLG